MNRLPTPGRAAALALAALALGAPACGGDDDGNRASLTARYCDSLKPASQACDTPDQQASEDQACRETWGACLVALVRNDSVEPVARCLEARGCTRAGDSVCECQKSDDDCFEEVGQTMPASLASDSYQRACGAKVAECENFEDDYCTDGDFPWRLFNDNTFQSITPCFEKACDEVAACISAVFNTISGGACSNLTGRGRAVRSGGRSAVPL